MHARAGSRRLRGVSSTSYIAAKDQAATEQDAPGQQVRAKREGKRRSKEWCQGQFGGGV